jgi:glutaredoxin 2
MNDKYLVPIPEKLFETDNPYKLYDSHIDNLMKKEYAEFPSEDAYQRFKEMQLQKIVEMESYIKDQKDIIRHLEEDRRRLTNTIKKLTGL